MNILSLIFSITFTSFSAQATEWPAELTGTISQQDCETHFANGKWIELPLIKNQSEKFNLFYFSVNPINTKLPTLLYVDGGPGQASGAGPNTLRFTNLKEFNVVFFHPRGVGCSAMPANNQFDQTLSTEQNADDIEAIRKHIGISQWGAVFGVSYGTVSGLKYSERYPTSVKHLIFEGLFNPAFPKDKVAIAIQKGLPTLQAVYQKWPEYSAVTAAQIQFIQEQTLGLFVSGKAVNSQGVELNDQQVNNLLVVLYSSTYQGVYSPGSLNKNGTFNAANALLKIFYTPAELPMLPVIQYEFANNLPYSSLRVYVNTALQDSLELDFITALSDPSKDLMSVIAEYYGDVAQYLNVDTTKEYKLIQLPASLDPQIQMTLLLGTEDGITYYDGAVEYLKTLKSSYTLYGLKGFGHQRHFDDVCYSQLIRKILNNEKLDSLFADKTSSCFLPEGFVR